MQRSMPRRAFLARSVAIVAGLGFGLAARVGLTANHIQVYTLDPFWPVEDPYCSGGCAACSACAKHAANKIFASHTAADSNRAHTNCKCQIVEKTLPSASWRLLFGNPSRPRREVVDRRNPATERLLRRIDI